MSKNRSNIPSIYSLVSELKKSELKPVYYLFGEDTFTINNAVKALAKKVEPFLSSDFDRETINLEKKSNIHELLDLAYAFPFGSDKKLIIAKNFENIKEKSLLIDYLNSPSESTILIITHFGKVNNEKSEPYKTLIKNKQIFHARELKGRDLQVWVMKRAHQLNYEISNEDVQVLIEIVGEDKSLIEMQLQKFKSFLGESKNITTEAIRELSSKTKEYTIFDLLNAAGKGNLTDSLKVINNLIDNGMELVRIITMLTKFLNTIAQSLELQKNRVPDVEAAKQIGVSSYYYINCKKAVFFKKDINLVRGIKTLYKTDLSLKTSGIQHKTLANLMIASMLSNSEKIIELV